MSYLEDAIDGATIEVDRLKAKIEVLERTNADLLAACEAFLALFRECDMRPEDECHEVAGTIRGAVAKAAKGGDR